MRNILPFLAFALLVSGCARTVHLYPTNDLAQQTGVLEGHFKAYGTGHVTITATMPDGEELNGEATVVRGGDIGFGTIFASASGTGGYASGMGTSIMYDMPGSSPGMASLYGTHGTSMQCEFMNDNNSGHGYGGCKASTGALYRLQY